MEMQDNDNEQKKRKLRRRRHRDEDLGLEDLSPLKIKMNSKQSRYPLRDVNKVHYFTNDKNQRDDSDVNDRRKRNSYSSTGSSSRRRRRGRRAHRQHFDSSSDSSSSDSDGFETYQIKKNRYALSSILPINLAPNDKRVDKKDLSRADVTPIEIDSSITWDNIGGLNDHILDLKEMVLLPLFYPNIFENFSISPPRGVLFYGPPGTGKTLVARALANSCSDGGQHISFFMRKGADCLSKWVGEAERQLRLLFEQAKHYQPSIIFFDEIDGLAPVRSAKQDQIHSSIVSTLLALMDGLDKRGQVIVIGATNRIDAIDPALRRPGRFDRELYFPLPNEAARKKIIDIHTKEWNPPLSVEFRNYLSQVTSGYCGADIKALCSEAALRSIRRQYPQIYQSNKTYVLNPKQLRVLIQDFSETLGTLIPCEKRSQISYGAPLPSILDSLLRDQLNHVIDLFYQLFPVNKDYKDRKNRLIAPYNTQLNATYGIINNDLCDKCHKAGDLICCDGCIKAFHLECIDNSIKPLLDSDDKWYCQQCRDEGNKLDNIAKDALEVVGSLLDNSNNGYGLLYPVYRPRLIISGENGDGQDMIISSLLHHYEYIPLIDINIPSLTMEVQASPEEALCRRIHEARKHCPCILYIENIDKWWDYASQSLQNLLLSILDSLPPTLPILFLSSSSVPFEGLEQILKDLFVPISNISLLSSLYTMIKPTKNQLKEFYKPLLLNFDKITIKPEEYESEQPPIQVLKQRIHKGPSPLEVEQEKQEEEYKEHCFRELRNFLRSVLTYLERERKYKPFVDFIDPDEVPDYYTIIANPICINKMHDKVDNNEYPTVELFLSDIDLLVRNAKEYNPNNSEGRNIIRAAIQLKDDVLSYQHRFSNKLGYDLFGECKKYYELANEENKSDNEIKADVKEEEKENDDDDKEEEKNEEEEEEEENQGKVVSKLRHACDRTEEILPPPSQSESVSMSQEEVTAINEVTKLGKSLYNKLTQSKQSINNHYQIYLRIKGIITESKLKCDMNFLLQEFQHLLEIIS